MKSKDLFLIIPVAIFTLLLFIPLPPLAVKICWLLDCIFAVTILGFSVYGIIRKAIPKPMAVLVLYFTLFTLALFVGTTRFVLQISPDNCDEIVLVSKIAKDIFISGTYSGYILFATAILIVNSSVYAIKVEKDGNLAGSVKFMRGTLNAMMIILVAAILGCCLIGYKKFDMTILDAFKFYIPYCCSQFIIYSIPLLIGTVGIDLLRWIDRDI